MPLPAAGPRRHSARAAARPIRLILGLVTLVAAAWPAWANDRDLRALSIGAASCTIYYGNNIDDGGNHEPLATDEIWTGYSLRAQGRAAPGEPPETIEVAFTCPLPVSAVSLDPHNDRVDSSSLRITYRDGDGMGLAAGILLYLIRTDAGTPFGNYDYVCGLSETQTGTATGYASLTLPCVHAFQAGSFYHLAGILYSASTSVPAEFVGVEFP